MTRCLLFASLLFIFGEFSSEVPHQTPADTCFNSSIPKFSSALYSTSIDVVGHHISGLLFLKTMPDSSQRAVFSNEAGITYFDFEWKKNGGFKTYHVIKKLRRKIVLNALRKDFELILVPQSLIKSISKANEREYSTLRKKEKLIFKTDQQCQSIRSIEVIGRKSKLVEARFFPEGKNIPDSVAVVHYNFDMKIGFKKLAH